MNRMGKSVVCLCVGIWLLSLPVQADSSCHGNVAGLEMLGCATQHGQLTGARCVAGRVLSRTHHESFLTWDYRDTNAVEFRLQSIEMSASTDILLGAMRGRVGASLEDSSSEKRLDKTQTLWIQISQQAMWLNDVERLPLTSDCGDGFVSEIVLAIKAALTLRLRFYEESRFRKFNAKYEASALWGLIKVKGELNDELVDLTKDADVFVELNQVGASLGDLAHIETSDNAIQCRIHKDLASCLDLFEQFRTYLETGLSPEVPLFPMRILTSGYDLLWR